MFLGNYCNIEKNANGNVFKMVFEVTFQYYYYYNKLLMQLLCRAQDEDKLSQYS